MTELRFSGVGRLLRIGSKMTTNGKETCTAIIEIDGDWPQMVPMKLWGRLIDVAWAIASVVSSVGHWPGRRKRMER
jgi:hypothetical protein